MSLICIIVSLQGVDYCSAQCWARFVSEGISRINYNLWVANNLQSNKHSIFLFKKNYFSFTDVLMFKDLSAVKFSLPCRVIDYRVTTLTLLGRGTQIGNPIYSLTKFAKYGLLQVSVMFSFGPNNPEGQKIILLLSRDLFFKVASWI